LLKTTLFLLGAVLVLVGFAQSQSVMAMSGNVAMIQPTMVDTSGQKLTSFHAGQQIGVESTLTNNGQSEQKFAYMVQVLGSSGQTEYFESTSASMLPNQAFTTSQVWIPKTTGQYIVEVFVWNSLSSAIPLTNVSQIPVTVN
jgi:hypothetical protein